jgi:hypothetical protein
MSTIRIILYNDAVYNKVREMWFKENRIKKTMLKQFIRVESFVFENARGIDIILITKLIKPSHLLSQIDDDLKNEGFTSKDYIIKVINNE